MTERWIAGIDGSDGSLAALRWSVANARRAGAQVLAVTAFRVPLPLAMLGAKRGFDVDRLGMEAAAHHLLDAAVDTVGGHDVQTLVVDDVPRTALLTSAEDASLLVVGRRGSGGLRNLVLGSVSTYCATHATVPVVVVPPDAGGTAFESVAVGFDGSVNAGAAVRWALDFVPDDIPISLVMAIEPAPWLGEDVTLARFPEEVRREEERLTAAADELDPTGRATREVRLHGPRQALVEATAAADLVVVGARGHGRVGAALLGSVSTWVLHHAPCAIAVVPGA